MQRIAFIGGPGAGKSTLATDVFTRLKKTGISAELVTEWIRQDIQINGPLSSIWEQYRTLQHQREIEDSIPEVVDYVITDSGTLTPYFYSCLYCDRNDRRQRLVLIDMFKYFIHDIYTRRYDHVFFCPIRETYQANENILRDGTRFQTQEDVNILDYHMNTIFMVAHHMPNIHRLDVPLDQRVDQVLEILGVS